MATRILSWADLAAYPTKRFVLANIFMGMIPVTRSKTILISPPKSVPQQAVRWSALLRETATFALIRRVLLNRIAWELDGGAT